MSRTRTQVRQAVARELGFDVYTTGTADSGGTTTTLVDGPLGLREDDYYIGASIYLTSGTPTYAELMVTDSVQSTGTATFRPALGAAPDALTYEMLPFPATQIHNAIQDTLNELYQKDILSRQFYLRGIVTGSPAYNAGFDYWDAGTSSIPHGYEFVSGSTVAKETSIVGISDQNMKLTSSIVRPTQIFRRFFYEFIGQTVTLRCWVYTTAASNARIAVSYVDAGSTTTTNSSYHTGAAGWELLEVSIAVPSTAEDIQPRFDSGATAGYFSDWSARGSTIPMEYPFPVAMMPYGPTLVQYTLSSEVDASPNLRQQARLKSATPMFDWHQDETLDRRTGWIMFTNGQPPVGHRLYIQGRGPLTFPSTDGGYIEVTAHEESIVAKMTAAKILEQSMDRMQEPQRTRAAQRIGMLSNSVAQSISSQTKAVVLPWSGMSRTSYGR